MSVSCTAHREDEFHRVREAGAMVFTRSQLDSLLRTGALPPAAQPTKADPPRLYSRSGMSAGCVFTRSLGDRGALAGRSHVWANVGREATDAS